MNPDIYTQKSLEAVRDAQRLVTEHQNQQLEQVHLLLALLRQEDGLIPQLLKKMDISLESFDAATEAAVNNYVHRGKKQLRKLMEEQEAENRDGCTIR